MYAEKLLVNKIDLIFKLIFKWMDNVDELVKALRSVYVNVISKLKVTYSNDPSIKIKAISNPPLYEVSADLYEKYKMEYVDTLNSIKKLYKELEDARNTGKIKCPVCNGKGRIFKKKYIRERSAVTPYLYSEKCHQCGGSGYLTISKDFIEQLDYSIKIIRSVIDFVLPRGENHV